MSKPKMKIDVVRIDDDVAALALRSTLEAFGAQVILHYVATAQDMARILGGEEELADCIAIMCHGSAKGLHMPELHPSVDKDQPYHGDLTPDNVRELMKLPGKFVLNDGCSMGAGGFPDAFLDAGCRAYIGPVDDPEGASALFYAIRFFYGYTCRGLSVREAHEAARDVDDETRMFRLFGRDT